MSAVAEAIRKQVGAGHGLESYKKRVTVRVGVNTLFRLQLLADTLRESKTRVAEIVLDAAVKDALAAAGIDEGHPENEAHFREFIEQIAEEWLDDRREEEATGQPVESEVI